LILAAKEERPRLRRRATELAERISGARRERAYAELAERHALQHHRQLTEKPLGKPYVLEVVEWQ
jgi:hypothetical protein